MVEFERYMVELNDGTEVELNLGEGRGRVDHIGLRIIE